MDRYCSVENCDRTKIVARGWCGRHYQRWIKYGDPDARGVMAPNGLGPEERLRYVGWTINDSGCWEWNGSRFHSGYGQVYFEKKNWKTHRLAYTVWVGPIPEGHVVRHKCDNPPCINPEHLETGSNSQNSDDMVVRGRSLSGERSKRAKLTRLEVMHIRDEDKAGVIPRKMLAEAFGVSTDTIHDIINGRSWASV